MSDVSGYVQGVKEGAIIEAAEVNLIAVLKPTLTIDGSEYCWRLGENLQDGVCGFGKSPYLAALAFNKAFYAELPVKSADTASVNAPAMMAAE